MRKLSANDIVQIWEWGQDKHPVDRALALLERAAPELALEQLQRLTIGQRNSRLLSLREQLLGPALKALATCEACGETLEFSVEIGAIRQPEPDRQVFDLQTDGLILRFRPINSLDLTSIVGLTSISEARLRLIECCLIEAARDGQTISASKLPESTLAALVDAMTGHDPQAEIRFQLTCAACGHRWSALFDIVSFLWSELDARAKQLLVEVHSLALAYGWREADILAMSDIRRRNYLEMIG